MESSYFSGSSKRAKAPGNITQVARCLVDGCNADLSLCRDYHRRHKVCEIHSKTPTVTIGGREQRFCQQCSRFHSLVEFDEGKRSCRKRLDGHNRRRRKPHHHQSQQGSTTINNSSLLSFSSSTPQILPSSPLLGFSWVKPDDNQMLPCNNNNQNYMAIPNSFPKEVVNYNCQLLETTFIQQGGSSNNSSKMYSCSDHVECDGALSLLSSAPQVITRDQLVQTKTFLDPGHSLLPHHHNNMMEYNSTGYELAASQESKPQYGSNQMFHEHVLPTEGSSASGSHQTLTFIWE